MKKLSKARKLGNYQVKIQLKSSTHLYQAFLNPLRINTWAVVREALFFK